ncbi:hypothetical protein [Devosia epidermidihirudinis]|uniref:hypothetical protein n=1 Tax=Devosia epidermidihirudinis TaxID=1293439 RepID=UPI0012E0AE31|nr:hypothetical protein [Devosia epidermidihirudinis]
MLLDLSHTKPERAVELVLVIAERTDDQSALSYLGGGPLVNVLWSDAASIALKQIHAAPKTFGKTSVVREALSYAHTPEIDRGLRAALDPSDRPVFGHKQKGR